MTVFYTLLIAIFSILITNLLLFLWNKFVIKNFNPNVNNIFLKKIITKENLDFIFWMIINIFFFTYFVYFRFANQWETLYDFSTNNQDYQGLSEYSRSIILSKGLLLDMCPFMSLSLSISFILDKSKKITALLSPYAILGGVITLPFVSLSEPDATFNLHYFFIGTSTNPLFFFMHLYLLVFGIIGLRRYNSAKLTDYIWLHVIAISYFSYILIASRLLDVTYNVTGVVKNDWTDPIFGSWYNFAQIINIGYPGVMILGYCMGYIFIVSTWAIKMYWKNIISKIKSLIKKC